MAKIEHIRTALQGDSFTIAPKDTNFADDAHGILDTSTDVLMDAIERFEEVTSLMLKGWKSVDHRSHFDISDSSSSMPFVVFSGETSKPRLQINDLATADADAAMVYRDAFRNTFAELMDSYEIEFDQHRDGYRGFRFIVFLTDKKINAKKIVELETSALERVERTNPEWTGYFAIEYAD